MSSKAVIIALLSAIGLGVIAWIVTAGGGGGGGVGIPAGVPAIGVRPSEVRSIEVTGGAGSGSPRVIERRENAWVLVGDDDSAWPVEEGRVTAFLRIASGLVSAGMPTQETEDPDGAGVVFSTDAGETRVRFASRRIGGQVLASVDSGEGTRLAMVADDLVKTIESGVERWRSAAPFPIALSDVSRLSMSSDADALTVSRTERRWRLLLPIAAPAEEAQIGQLLASIFNLRIVDFLDDGGVNPVDAGLDDPKGDIRMFVDRRAVGDDDEVSVTTEEYGLLLGRIAESGTSTMYALLTHADRIVMLDAGPMDGVTAAAEAYVRRAASTAAKDDVHVIELRAPVGSVTNATGDGGASWRRIERTLNGWGESIDGDVKLFDAGARSQVDEMLAFVTERASTRVEFTPPESYEALVQVHFASLGGDPMDDIEFGLVGTGAQREFVMRHGTIYRRYVVERPVMVDQFLDEGLARRTDAPVRPVVGAGDGVDINK